MHAPPNGAAMANGALGAPAHRADRAAQARNPNLNASLCPPPLPLQASVSDIASAFGLDSNPSEGVAPPSTLPGSPGSPLRRARRQASVQFARSPEASSPRRSSRHDSGGDPLAPLPLQPTQSMANSGLDALDALCDFDEPEPANGAGGASLGLHAPSPLRRTRSRSLNPLPLQTSISELVSSFIAD